MEGPLIYIFAPLVLAFGLFVFYLVVSLFLRDPARPFRMFKAPPMNPEEESRQFPVPPSPGTGEANQEEDGSKFGIQDPEK